MIQNWANSAQWLPDIRKNFESCFTQFPSGIATLCNFYRSRWRFFQTSLHKSYHILSALLSLTGFGSNRSLTKAWQGGQSCPGTQWLIVNPSQQSLNHFSFHLTRYCFVSACHTLKNHSIELCELDRLTDLDTVKFKDWAKTQRTAWLHFE